MDSYIQPPKGELYDQLPQQPKIAINLWNSIWPPALYMVIQIVVSIVGTLLFVIGSAMFSVGTNEQDILESVIDTVYQLSMPFMAISMVFALAVFIPFYIRFSRGRERQTRLAEIGFGNGFLLLLLSATSYFSVIMILSFIPEKLSNQYSEHMLELTSGSFAWQLIVVGFGAPIVEELCLRGISQDRLMKIMPPAPAIFIQAAIFGIIHFNVVQGSYAFLLGILFGWICWRTRSLWPSFLLHLFINTCGVLMGEFVSSDVEVPVEPVEGSYIGVAVMLFFALAFTAGLLFALNKTLPGRKKNAAIAPPWES